MNKIEKENKRVENLKKTLAILPNLNAIITKAEPFILAYQKALKKYWKNNMSKEEFEKELIISGLMSEGSRYTDNRKWSKWSYELEELNKNYKQLTKI